MHSHEIILENFKKYGIDARSIDIFHLRGSSNENPNRFFPRDVLNQNEISPKGGKTVAILEIDGHRFTAESVCSPKESFNRRKGVTIALRRLYKNFVHHKKQNQNAN